MNLLANILCPNPRAVSSPVARAAISDMTFEVIPLKSLPDAIEQLPANARVSVTASPVKPLEDTLDVCAELLEKGHRPIPHIAARKVTDEAHMRSLATRIKQLGLSEIFCIAGDAQDAGAYHDAMSLLRPLLDFTAGDISAVGVSSYPDGHAFIDESALHQALLDKQELFAEAGIKGHASTQMCFSTDTIRSWLSAQRAEGFDMPVHLGVAGVVDRAKLIRMGMRLGVGASLRYVQKNRAGLLKLFSSVGYNPSDLIDPLADEFDSMGIEGLHMFTFNQVAATERWQQAKLG
ncbi:MAG: methylenetetrahydrofolate reductase [Acidimicrobiaceae bacterium]|nr:methylenetetrahydrofolate reductase [Acidimicrobiia bacterium]MCY4493266.1 methylenetetrahydrofolate reductase [Acidimicrobiaceae bacterium]